MYGPLNLNLTILLKIPLTCLISEKVKPKTLLKIISIKTHAAKHTALPYAIFVSGVVFRVYCAIKTELLGPICEMVLVNFLRTQEEKLEMFKTEINFYLHILNT